MSVTTDHRIETVDQLREVIGVPIEGIDLKVGDALDDHARAFLAKAPFLVLSTADADGNVDASPKGDEPGFVLIEDERTLVIPDRPGNKLAMGLQNILVNPHVGVLFMIPGTTETLRVNGRAELSRDPALLEELAARGKPAVLAIRVTIDEAFFHCAKAFIRSKLWKPETWPEKQRISFGKMFAEKIGGTTEEQAAIETEVEALVEEDYCHNL
jgi:PPOX class probable FMN-dependent enzyme